MNLVLEALANLGFDWQIALANLVNFLLIFFLLKKYFFGGLKQTLDARKSKIERGIQDAESAKMMLLEAEDIKKEKILEANIASEELIQESKIKALKIGESIEAEAHNEATRIVELAKSKDIEFRKTSEQDIKKQVPILVVSLVEKILKEKLTPEENSEYINRILAK